MLETAVQYFIYGPETKKVKNIYKTRDGGYLGSHIDEERSKMRYVMRIAKARESLNL